MSTTATKRSYELAMVDAVAFRNLFPTTCYERWEFAGSLRRRVKEVGDFDHIVIPRMGTVTVDSGGLFGGEPQTVNLLWHHLDSLLSGPEIAKHIYGDTGFRWGEKLRGMDFRGFKHEIWTADGDNWGSQLAIRTGPAMFSKMLVNRLQTSGFCNMDGYVHNKDDMSCSHCGWQGRFVGLVYLTPAEWQPLAVENKWPKPKWVNGKDKAGICPGCRSPLHLTMARVSMPDEREYFRYCGVSWLDPHRRFDPAQPSGGSRGPR